MPRQPKPNINWGPADDALKKLIKIALAGGKGAAKKQQAQRIVKNMPYEMQGKMYAGTGKLSGQFARSATKRRNMASITKDAQAHSRRMSAEGLNWDGSPNKAVQRKRAAAARRSAVQKKKDADALANALAREKGKEFADSVTRQMNLAEVSRKKGEGIYKSTTGRTKYVGKEGAAAARSRAGGVEAALKKRFDTANAKYRALEKIAKDPKASRSKRNDARRLMREHEAKFGRPTSPPSGSVKVPRKPEPPTGGVRVPRKPKQPRSPQGARK